MSDLTEWYINPMYAKLQKNIQQTHHTLKIRVMHPFILTRELKSFLWNVGVIPGPGGLLDIFRCIFWARCLQSTLPSSSASAYLHLHLEFLALHTEKFLVKHFQEHLFGIGISHRSSFRCNHNTWYNNRNCVDICENISWHKKEHCKKYNKRNKGCSCWCSRKIFSAWSLSLCKRLHQNWD